MVWGSFIAPTEVVVKLHEYQTKQIFARYGIPVPTGAIASTPEGAGSIAAQIGGHIVVKSQVLVGRCRKAGGIRIVSTPQEARMYTNKVLGATIRGRRVQKVLVEEAIETVEEFYMAIMIDRTARKPVLIAAMEEVSPTNGVAKNLQKLVTRQPIDPLLGLHDFEARNIAYDLGLKRETIQSFVAVGQGLYRAFVESDASLVELNPLAVTPAGTLIALGAKMDLDEAALFRHPDLAEQRDVAEENAIERQAREVGLSYVKLDGNIGLMVNGAGLAMATMDIIAYYGGRAANFLDLDDEASADKVGAALYMNLIDPQVKVVFCNIFGNTTRCDEVARGILVARDLVSVDLPLIIRLIGLNEQEGRNILAQAGLSSTRSLSEAARQAVLLAGGGTTA